MPCSEIHTGANLERGNKGGRTSASLFGGTRIGTGETLQPQEQNYKTLLHFPSRRRKTEDWSPSCFALSGSTAPWRMYRAEVLEQVPCHFSALLLTWPTVTDLTLTYRTHLPSSVPYLRTSLIDGRIGKKTKVLAKSGWDINDRAGGKERVYVKIQCSIFNCSKNTNLKEITAKMVLRNP